MAKPICHPELLPRQPVLMPNSTLPCDATADPIVPPQKTLHRSRSQGLAPSYHRIGWLILSVLLVQLATAQTFNEATYQQQLAEIAQQAVGTEKAVIENWLPPERADQQLVYFLHGRTPKNIEFRRLCVQRCEALLKQAASVAADDQLAESYRLFWTAARDHPTNADVRRVLGLPASGRMPISVTSTRNSEPLVQWPARSYIQVLSPHFQISARGPRQSVELLAHHLERAYWAWTQVFFPLWVNKPVYKRALTGSGRFESRVQRHRVILFTNRQEYVDTLSKDIPGIERSTGFYHDQQKIIFLYHDPNTDYETLFHELTHQLLNEASQMRVSQRVGEKNDFWLVEGIAAFMESMRFHATYGTVGGWESQRLQFARHRVRGLRQTIPIEQLIPLGRLEAQSLEDIGSWYSYSAAYAHLNMQPPQRSALMDYIRSVYETPEAARTTPKDELVSFLNVSDSQIKSLPSSLQLSDLCLANTHVTAAGLQSLSNQNQLRWLDLKLSPASDAAIANVLRSNSRLEELILEQTQASSGCIEAISKMNKLRELDLTSAPINDQHVAMLKNLQKLEVLWLTASLITDAAIETIGNLPNLKQVDVQLTRVSDQGLAALKAKRPNLTINPLSIQTQ